MQRSFFSAELSAHRSLFPRLAAIEVGADTLFRVGSGEAVVYLAGANRVESVVKAVAEGRSADADPIDLEAHEFLVLAGDPRSRKAATELHLRSLTKATGGALDRHLMRPVSRQLTRLLCRTRVTPNFISIFSLGLALLSAVLIATPVRSYVVAGGLLHIAMRIIDCVRRGARASSSIRGRALAPGSIRWEMGWASRPSCSGRPFMWREKNRSGSASGWPGS